eukprot:g9688.t1
MDVEQDCHENMTDEIFQMQRGRGSSGSPGARAFPHNIVKQRSACSASHLALKITAGGAPPGPLGASHATQNYKYNCSTSSRDHNLIAVREIDDTNVEAFVEQEGRFFSLFKFGDPVSIEHYSRLLAEKIRGRFGTKIDQILHRPGEGNHGDEPASSGRRGPSSESKLGFGCNASCGPAGGEQAVCFLIPPILRDSTRSTQLPDISEEEDEDELDETSDVDDIKHTADDDQHDPEKDRARGSKQENKSSYRDMLFQQLQSADRDDMTPKMSERSILLAARNPVDLSDSPCIHNFGLSTDHQPGDAPIAVGARTPFGGYNETSFFEDKNFVDEQAGGAVPLELRFFKKEEGSRTSRPTHLVEIKNPPCANLLATSSADLPVVPPKKKRTLKRATTDFTDGLFSDQMRAAEEHAPVQMEVEQSNMRTYNESEVCLGGATSSTATTGPQDAHCGQHQRTPSDDPNAEGAAAPPPGPYANVSSLQERLALIDEMRLEYDDKGPRIGPGTELVIFIDDVLASGATYMKTQEALCNRRGLKSEKLFAAVLVDLRSENCAVEGSLNHLGIGVESPLSALVELLQKQTAGKPVWKMLTFLLNSLPEKRYGKLCRLLSREKDPRYQKIKHWLIDATIESGLQKVYESRFQLLVGTNDGGSSTGNSKAGGILKRVCTVG